uniref:BRCA2 OB3 domain-containing protein n=1 Tax=Clastoptera arizonana TaxID=38151 RepID=A0A1B6EGI9_9HEMI
MESGSDPEVFQNFMSAEQLKTADKYFWEQKDKKFKNIQLKIEKQLEEEIPPRKVIPLLKVRLLEPESKHCSLTIWRPSTEIINLFIEGCRLSFFNVTPNGYRNGELQLSAGKQTRYEVLNHEKKVFPRTTTPLDIKSLTMFHMFNEIDVVGIVIQVTPNTVYICDTQLNLFGVHFWPGLKELGWNKLLVPERIVAASNLQLHQEILSWNIPYGYCSDLSLFSTNPSQHHLANAMANLKEEIKGKDILNIIMQSTTKLKSLLAHRNYAGAPPCTNKCKDNVSLSHKRDADETDCTESSVKKKMKLLQKYGEPPPLSPLCLNSRSKVVKRQFCAPNS